MSKLAVAAAFLVGAAGGSLATWKLLKDRYAKRSQEEIDSAKQTFFKLLEEERAKHISGEPCEDREEEKTVAMKEIRPIIDDRYISDSMTKTINTTYDSIYKDIRERDEQTEEPDISYRSEPFVPKERPYVIDPHDMGEFDYTMIVLTFYEDGIVADENDEIVEDVERVVGTEALDILKDHETPVVCVRNDRFKCDYEISSDHRSYFDEILPGKPSSFRETL